MNRNSWECIEYTNKLEFYDFFDLEPIPCRFR